MRVRDRRHALFIAIGCAAQMTICLPTAADVESSRTGSQSAPAAGEPHPRTGGINRSGITSGSLNPRSTQRAFLDVSTLDCLVEPHLTVEVATAATGIAKEIRVDRGDIVRSGEVLARLEDEVEKANVAHAQARMAFSSRKFERMQELYKEQMVSSQELDEARAEHDLAQAELQKASELLKQRTILSPFAGVIVDRYVSPGELVENNKIVKMAQIDPLNVEIVAPVSMLGTFKMGSRVQVFPEGPIAGPLEARVKRVDRVIDAASGTFRVRLDLPNPRYKISAGVRCKAKPLGRGRN